MVKYGKKYSISKLPLENIAFEDKVFKMSID